MSSFPPSISRLRITPLPRSDAAPVFASPRFAGRTRGRTLRADRTLVPSPQERPEGQSRRTHPGSGQGWKRPLTATSFSAAPPPELPSLPPPGQPGLGVPGTSTAERGRAAAPAPLAPGTARPRPGRGEGRWPGGDAPPPPPAAAAPSPAGGAAARSSPRGPFVLCSRAASARRRLRHRPGAAAAQSHPPRESSPIAARPRRKDAPRGRAGSRGGECEPGPAVPGEGRGRGSGGDGAPEPAASCGRCRTGPRRRASLASG